jgi:CubicO group peptidase (beta-lactamase class C family)
MRCWLKLTRGPMTRTGSIQPGAVTHLYLQRAIEQLTGIPLQTLAERELFGPLRLRLSSYIWRERWTNVAEGHGTSSTGGRRFATAFRSFSLHTTAAEYAQLIAAIVRDHHDDGLFESAVCANRRRRQLRAVR